MKNSCNNHLNNSDDRTYAFNDGFFIYTKDLERVHARFRRNIKQWCDLLIIGSRNSGKSSILDYLMRSTLPHISLVYQAGVHPNLRREVCDQLIQEVYYQFDKSDKFIVFLDEFDTLSELTRLAKELRQYDYLTILASNKTPLRKYLYPTDFIELQRLSTEEARMILRQIAKRLLQIYHLEKTLNEFLNSINVSDTVQALLEYSEFKIGGFIMLATKLLLDEQLFGGKRSIDLKLSKKPKKLVARTNQKIFKVMRTGELRIVEKNLTWIGEKMR